LLKKQDVNDRSIASYSVVLFNVYSGRSISSATFDMVEVSVANLYIQFVDQFSTILPEINRKNLHHPTMVDTEV